MRSLSSRSAGNRYLQIGARTALCAILALAAAGAMPAPGAAQSASPGGAAVKTPIAWQPLYEPGCGGAIVSVRVSPHNPKHIVSAGDMLGVATSFDGGDSWKPTFGFTTYEMADVTFHPTDPKIVWLGSCSGPYKSVDGGIHFVSRRAGMPAPSDGRYTAIVEKVLFDPARPSRMLAFGGSSRRWNSADSFGWVWESVDGGDSWKRIGTIAKEGFSTEAKKGANIVHVEYVPGSKTALSLLADGAGWFTSEDGGRTWAKKVYAGVPTGVSSVTYHPKNPSVVWVTTGSYTTGQGDATREPGGIFKSVDGGKTFAPSDKGINKVNAKQGGSLSSNFNNVVVSAANPDVLYTNDGAWNAAIVYKSVDGGASWKPVASRAGVGVEHEHDGASVFQPKTATFAGIAVTGTADPSSADRTYWYNTEFILRTVDGGRTWDDATAYQPDAKNQPDHWRGRGWVGWCSTNFAWNPYKKGQAIAQAMDAGRGWVSDDDLKSWRFVSADKTHPWLGGQDATFTRDGHIYVSTGQFGESNGIFRSADFGKTWTLLEGEKRGLPKAGWGNRPEFAGIYAHPEQKNLVWVALGGKVLRSADAGETWSPVETTIDARYFAGDPTKPGRFYVTGKQGVYVTEDGGSFTSIGGPRPAGRGRINCDSKGRVLVCQWRDGRAGVWRYTPAEKRWERLLDEPLAFECVADPSDPDRLLMVTNMDPYHDFAGGNGVWISADGGKSWSRQDAGLAMLRGQAVAFNPHDPEQVVVGTFGRGFFLARWPKSFAPQGERRYTAQPEDAVASEVGGSILANGAMSEGGDKPAGWGEVWDNVKSARDTETFKSAPSSLRVTADGGKGMAFQQVAGRAGQRFRITGFVKSKGSARVNVAVQAFDEKWSRNQFDQIAYLQNDTDWQAFDKTIAIPDWAARFNVALLVEGTGTAWLDDIRMVQMGGDKPAQAQPAAAPAVPAAPAAPATAGAAVAITRDVRDFGPSGFDYTYGQDWKNGQNVTTGKDGDVGYVQIDSTEHGGAGLVLNGANLVPQKQTHLALRARLLPGNQAQRLSVNLVGSDKSITFDLSKLNDREWVTLLEPLPDGGKYGSVQQAQVQGTNWSGAAQPLKIRIDRIGTTTADEKANAAAQEAAAKLPGNGPAPKGKPAEPGWGFYPNFPNAWMTMHNGFVNRTKQGNVNIVFFGDSITQGWDKEIWEKRYAPRGAVNYGIGGDSTRQVLWRIQNGEVDGITPKLVVLKIGTNNLYGDNNAGSDEEIAAGIAKIVETLRQKLPTTKILLLGILPRQNEYFSGRIARINAIVQKLDDGKTVRFLDVGAKFQSSLGKVNAPLYSSDQLHLARPGYEVLADAMQPLLDEMLR